MKIRKKEFETSNSIYLDTGFMAKYFGKANPDFVVLYLYLLMASEKGGEITYDELAKTLGMSIERITEGVLYWAGQNMLKAEGDVLQLVAFTLAKTSPKTDRPPTYSGKEMAKYIDSDKELKTLYESAQKILGKMLSTSDINILFSLYDWLRMPTGVICILLEYCVENGKMSMKYIEKTAISWVDNGILTVDDAILFVRTERRKKEYTGEVKKSLGIFDRKLTMLEQQKIAGWQMLGMPVEMVAQAYEITVNRTGKFAVAYMDKIISTWAKEGIRTKEQLQAASNAYEKSRQQAAKQEQKQQGSYDYDNILKENTRKMMEKYNRKQGE